MHGRGMEWPAGNCHTSKMQEILRIISKMYLNGVQMQIIRFAAVDFSEKLGKPEKKTCKTAELEEIKKYRFPGENHKNTDKTIKKEGKYRRLVEMHKWTEKVLRVFVQTNEFAIQERKIAKNG